MLDRLSKACVSNVSCTEGEGELDSVRCPPAHFSHIFHDKICSHFVISAAYASPHSPGEHFAGVLSGPLFLRAEEKFFGLSGGLYFPVLFS